MAMKLIRLTDTNEHGEYAKLEREMIKGYCLAQVMADDGSWIMRARAEDPDDAAHYLADRLAAAQHWAQRYDTGLGQKADRHLSLATALQAMRDIKSESPEVNR